MKIKPRRTHYILRDKAFGDCSNCRHSLAYHIPFVGCIKCDCDEYE